MNMKRLGADVSEAVFPVGWNNKRLPGGQNGVAFVDPHLRRTGNNGKHFLDRV